MAFYRKLDAEAVLIVAPGVIGVDLLQDPKMVAERIFMALGSLRGNLTIIEKKRFRQRSLAKRGS